MTKKPDSLKEEFSRFFEEPTRDKLRGILQNNLGEFNYLDFKKEILEYSKMAKHILGLANTGGGAVVFGVAQDDGDVLRSVGVSEFVDKTTFSQKVSKFLPDLLEFRLLDFEFTSSEYVAISGLKFQTLLVLHTPDYLPFVSESDGSDIFKGRIYVRNQTNTEEASYNDIQRIISERIKNGFDVSSKKNLEEHFSQLKTLYKHIEKGHTVYEDVLLAAVGEISRSIRTISGLERFETNPKYPSEDFDDFVVRLIAVKKQIIETIVKA